MFLFFLDFTDFFEPLDIILKDNIKCNRMYVCITLLTFCITFWCKNHSLLIRKCGFKLFYFLCFRASVKNVISISGFFRRVSAHFSYGVDIHAAVDQGRNIGLPSFVRTLLHDAKLFAIFPIQISNRAFGKRKVIYRENEICFHTVFFLARVCSCD